MRMIQTAKDLKRRKLVTLVTLKSHKVTRGAQYAPQRVKKAADLTKEMLDFDQILIRCLKIDKALVR